MDDLRPETGGGTNLWIGQSGYEFMKVIRVGRPVERMAELFARLPYYEDGAI